MNEREARRNALECDFARHEARHSLLSGKLNQARARRAEALAALNAADDSISRLERRCNEVALECAGIRRLIEFDPTIVNRLPTELLRAIWSELRASIVPQTPWENIQAAKRQIEALLLLPCQLSAVCPHWRTVALNTPELWSDIALPPTSVPIRNHELFLKHVELQLKRSYPRTLDVILLHPLPAYGTRCFESVMRLACQHAGRWRRAAFWFPSRLRADMLNEMLAGCSLPLLEELRVSSSGDPWSTGPWLRTATSLASFAVRGIQFSPPSSLRLDTVVTTHLQTDTSSLPSLWASLQAFPSLQSLSLLILDRTNVVTAPSANTTLPRLEMLKLRGRLGPYETILAQGLSAPRLKRLNIEVGAVEEDAEWGRAFFAAFPSIVELELCGGGNVLTTQTQWPPCHTETRSSRLASLGRLNSLKSVVFQNCRFYKEHLSGFGNNLLLGLNVCGETDVHHDGPCCDRNCPPPRLVWPELESVTVSSVGLVEADEVLLADLACFVRTRADACAARGTQFKFSLLDWPSALPSWFPEALAFVLGPANMRLPASDAAVALAPLGDNRDGDDDPGAELTGGPSSGDESSSGASDSSSEAYSEGHSDESGEEWLPGSNM